MNPRDRHPGQYPRLPDRRRALRHAPYNGAQESGRPLFAAALLGLYWNIGALVVYGVRDIGLGEPSPLFAASAFTALGFLPAVVVDSALSSSRVVRRSRHSYAIVFLAYALSAIAGVLQFYAAAATGTSPSALAFRTLTFGFGMLMLALVLETRQQTGWGRAIWAVALAVFAVSALHLSEHRGAEVWWIELAGHHASLPLRLRSSIRTIASRLPTFFSSARLRS